MPDDSLPNADSAKAPSIQCWDMYALTTGQSVTYAIRMRKTHCGTFFAAALYTMKPELHFSETDKFH